MKIQEILPILQAHVHTGQQFLDRDVNSACGADLMSDVMAFVKEDVLLLTGLAHIQTIRTAGLLDIEVIIFVRGKLPDDSMIAEAEKNGIVLMSTEETLFTACGKLYAAGLRTGKSARAS